MVLVLEPYMHNLVPEFCWNLWENTHFKQTLFSGSCSALCSFQFVNLLDSSFPSTSSLLSYCYTWTQGIVPDVPVGYSLLFPSLQGNLICSCYMHCGKFFNSAWISRLTANATPFLHHICEIQLPDFIMQLRQSLTPESLHVWTLKVNASLTHPTIKTCQKEIPVYIFEQCYCSRDKHKQFILIWDGKEMSGKD